MGNAFETAPAPTDSPEARRYNRIRRWLGIADFLLGLILLIVLLATGWNGTLRDLAMHGAYEHYTARRLSLRRHAHADRQIARPGS